MADRELPMQLHQLPDPCLLAVLQYCAQDLGSLFSAARAHSRLHQAAVEALRCISVHRLTQQRVNQLMRYLSKHGQHVDSIDLSAESFARKPCELLQLPKHLKLQVT
jgi:hypothetical protein